MKLLHIADTHIGVENYGRVDPMTGLHSRLQEFGDCVRYAFEFGIREQVDLVLFAGDAYKSCNPTPTHQQEFAKLLKLLGDAGIPIVMVTGNHDIPVSHGKATSVDIFNALSLAGPGIYVQTAAEVITVDTKSGPIQVACFPWLTRAHLAVQSSVQLSKLSQEEVVDRLEDLGASMITWMARQIHHTLPAVFLGHLTAAESTYAGSETIAEIGSDPLFLLSTLADSAFDYVALGHIHAFQDLNENSLPPVVYSGSIDRVDFGEEEGEKGFCLVEIDNYSKGVDYRFVPTPAKRFQTIRVEVGKGENPTDAVVGAIALHEISRAVVRVIYDLEEGHTGTVNVSEVARALQYADVVSSIAAKPRVEAKRGRSEISESMGLREALHVYIQGKPELADIEDELQQTAAELFMELVVQ